MARVKKKERQQLLLQQVKEKPFLTDEELAQKLGVSVQTIRLDRLELGIPELRGRIRKMAESAQNKAVRIHDEDIFSFEDMSGRQIIRYLDWHENTSFHMPRQ